MSEAAIQVENLSKRYVLSHLGDPRDALRHRLEEAIRNPGRLFRKLRRSTEQTREEFWALKDVSVEIKRGDVVGIIGRNGAGKSTLLKILSRITEPTTGRIVLRGKIASLLEVGTGFHQELTGRENIFLNGAILGMTKSEISARFDEIVAFSEIERFLDTPVKRYSSGMYVRLAFAVAAHLEPDILVVDEVLAVGDAAFQKKCLGKMGQVAKGGRTVLFVSHNMAAVQTLCNTGLYLERGRKVAFGPVDAVLHRYMADVETAECKRLEGPISLSDAVDLVRFDFTPAVVRSGESLEFAVGLRTKRPCRLFDLCLLLYSAQQVRVGLIDLRSAGLPAPLDADHRYDFTGRIPQLPLVEGEYSIGLGINTGDFHEDITDLASVTVTTRPRTDGCSPYAAIYRGYLDLDFDVAMRRSATAGP